MSYSSDVLLRPNLLNYWPCGELAGASAAVASAGGVDLTATGCTFGVAGQIDGTAVSLNGTSDALKSAANINLTTFGEVFVEAIIKIPNYTNNDRIMWEFGTTNAFTTGTGGFNLYMSLSTGAFTPGVIAAALRGDVGGNQGQWVRLPVNAFVHIIVGYRKTLTGLEIELWVNGTKRNAQYIPSSSNNTNTFGNLPLCIGARNAAASFQVCVVQHIAMYSAISDANKLAYAVAAGFTTSKSLEFTPSDMLRNGRTGPILDTPAHNAMAAVKFTTDGDTLLVGGWSTAVSINAAYSEYTCLVNGTPQYGQLAANGGGVVSFNLGTAGTLRTIEVREATGINNTPVSSWIADIVVQNATALTLVSPNDTNMVLGLGDSALVGFNATHPATGAWPSILVDTYGRNWLIEGTGSKSLWEYLGTGTTLDTTKSTAFAAKVVSWGVKYIWVQLAAGDFAVPSSVGRWSAAEYEAALADWMDRVHALDSTITFILMLAFDRGAGETTPNSFGSTLPDYRTAMSNVAATRSSWAKVKDGRELALPDDMAADGFHIEEGSPGAIDVAARVEAYWIATFESSGGGGTASLTNGLCSARRRNLIHRRRAA